MQFGNAGADIKLGRFEAMDLFPLGKDTVVEDNTYGGYRANSLRGRMGSNVFHAALGLNASSAVRVELGLVETKEAGKAKADAKPAARVAEPAKAKGDKLSWKEQRELEVLPEKIAGRDALVLIDCANGKRRLGQSALNAIHQAAIQRFRPILLTTVTTFGGLAPMIWETSRQARFLIPMALSLGFGIVFATFITLGIVPSLYMILEDLKRFARSMAK